MGITFNILKLKHSNLNLYQVKLNNIQVLEAKRASYYLNAKDLLQDTLQFLPGWDIAPEWG